MTEGSRDSLADFFLDSSHGWAVGAVENPSTRPVGKPDAQISGTNVHLDAVTFVDEKNGWVVGDQGTILHTDNGGSIWFKQQADTVQHLLGVCFLNDKLGWAVGASGYMLKTEDGGQTWLIQPAITKAWLEDVKFTDDKHGVAVGSAARSCALKTAAKPGKMFR